jgi:predicted phosphodiesterase
MSNMESVISRCWFKTPIYLLLIFWLLCPVVALAQSWQWIVYGDTRNNPPRTQHKEVLQAMMTNTPEFKFIINVGDVVDHGDVTDEWEGFIQETIEVLGSLGQDQVPPKYMATPGNHDATETEIGLANWNAYLPGQLNQYGNEGKFFVFDYENARFVIMDSDKSPMTGAQYTMLLDTIKNNPKTWLFAFWHHPIFDFGEKSYKDDIHDTWGIPLYQYGCDIIFVGHAHYYVRSKKLALNGDMNPPIDSLRGTVQIVTGNGGAPADIPVPSHDGNEYLVAAYSTTSSQYGYTELTVNADTMYMRHILRDGTVFDEAVFIANPKDQVNNLERYAFTIPRKNRLYQNYPNPFNPSTLIRFDLPKSDFVMLKVYDINGREIRTLLKDHRAGGNHEISFNGQNSSGQELTSGVYFYRLQTGSYSETKKMILIQ